MLLLYICVVFAFAANAREYTNDPIVHVEHGALHGKYSTSHLGKTFAAFQGVPYARPPVGKRRFKEPAPLKPWRGIWPAKRPGSECLQYIFVPRVHANKTQHVIGDEDCLYLNVYTPKLPGAGAAPLMDVIVVIPGEVFMFSSGTTMDPKYLMDYNVVYVTINYRVGILGFLSTEDEVVSGNMGLKDQNAALKWIQRNIAVFGGNPASITLIGSSAGAASVQYHYLSPMSHGLFQRGVAQSGGVLCPWAMMEAGRQKADKLGVLLGCNTQTSRELLECLKYRPGRLIVQQVPHFQEWIYSPLAPFGPTVEIAGYMPFLTRHPIDMLLERSVQDLPLIMGVTKEEGLFPAAGWIADLGALDELKMKFTDIAPHLFDYNFTSLEQNKPAIAKNIHDFYLNGTVISAETVGPVIKMLGDRHFYVGTEKAAKLQAKVNTAPVYFYIFDYKGKHSLSEVMPGTSYNYDVSRGDDLAYTTEIDYFGINETQEDQELSKMLLNIWTNFAKNGNPVPYDANFTWNAVTPDADELSYLHINGSTNLMMKVIGDLGNTIFWESLPLEEPSLVKLSKSHISDEL